MLNKQQNKKHYYQGKFRPKFPKKYKGNVSNIVYRSYWERRFMAWCDNNKKVIRWSSEETIITYISPLDNNFHRYFVDFTIVLKSVEGQDITVLVEVKPLKEVYTPSANGKKKVRYRKEVATYLVNQAKWKAATDYCDKRGYEFVIATDKRCPKTKLNETIDYNIWKIF